MLKIKEYVKAESLEQAYELNQKRTNRIIGGMLWMRMSDAQIQKAIDLSGLGLDQIEETEDAFILGCMVTLRQMELHEGLNAMCGGLIRKSVEDIVGVQFRNLATVGGSLLVVSQFTLYADTSSRRPGFTGAARPDVAIPLYERFMAHCRERGFDVQHGEFGADMQVFSQNDGPVTILFDTEA